MAQHDMSIANQGFPAFRADLNDALAALVSNSSGSSAPSTTFAHQLWVDTAANPSILKMRNADNDAWITVATIDQTGDNFVFSPAGGSASQVAYGVAGETDTGIFFPASDTIAFAEGGAEAMRIDSSGRVGVGTSSIIPVYITAASEVSPKFQIYGTSAATSTLSLVRSDNTPYFSFSNGSSGNNVVDNSVLGKIVANGYDGTSYRVGGEIAFEVDGTPGTGDMPGRLVFSTTADGASSPTERMRITSAGEVLVGGTTAIGSLQGYMSIERANDSPQLSIYRNDTSVSSGNGLGQIAFYGNDTTSNTPTRLAYIIASASGTHAAGDNPTDLVFGTTPDGTETVAEAARITQSGALVLKGGTTTAAAGVGIVFPATEVASANVNCLDDYEEGDWTPTYVPGTGAFTSITYDAVTGGKYTKIGRMVTVSGRIRTDAITVGTASGTVSIGGLPFTVGFANGFYNGLSIGDASVFGGDTPLSGYATLNGTTAVLIYRTSVNGGGTALDVTDLGTGANANQILFSMTYFTA